MIRKRICKLAAIVLTSFVVLASSNGYAGISHFSRANCINNESITWDYPWKRSIWGWVQSKHYYKGRFIHRTYFNRYQYSWRIAIVHWGEGRGGWTVRGDHRWYDTSFRKFRYVSSYATNCNISRW